MRSYILFLFLILISCGSLDTLSPTGDNNSTNGNNSFNDGDEAVFLFATDYASSGQIYSADMSDISNLSNEGVNNLGSSAIIRLYDGLLYVLHDGFSSGSSDNVQILDPQNNLATLNQWSTGNGTNPQDIVVSGSIAYITLYNPSSSGDVIVMDLENGDVIKNISFQSYLNADGDQTAHASQMVLADTTLYVLIQDTQSDFSQNTSGKIALINTNTNKVTDVITLSGSNPVSLAYSQTADRLFVANQAPYDYGLGNFDTSLAFGGLEIVDLSDKSTTLIADEDLGGYVERVVTGDGKLFAVISQMDSATFQFSSQIYSMDDSNEELSGLEVFLDNSSDVRDIEVDSQNRLWVSRRAISAADGSASNPKVDVFTISSGDKVGDSLAPVVPVTSIAIGEI